MLCYKAQVRLHRRHHRVPSSAGLVAAPAAAPCSSARAILQGILQHLPQGNVLRLQPLALIHGLVVHARTALRHCCLLLAACHLPCKHNKVLLLGNLLCALVTQRRKYRTT